MYAGEWKEGHQHGQGTLTNPEGRKYVGEWKDGLPHGQGKWTNTDGSTFVGEWNDGIPWNGTLYDEDGNVTATVSESVKTEQ